MGKGPCGDAIGAENSWACGGGAPWGLPGRGVSLGGKEGIKLHGAALDLPHPPRPPCLLSLSNGLDLPGPRFGLLLLAHSSGTFFPSSSLTFERSSSAPLPNDLKGTGQQALGLLVPRAHSFPLLSSGHSVLSPKTVFWSERRGILAAVCN